MSNPSTQFKPGESGNPNGRPAGSKNFNTLFNEALKKLAELNGKEPDELDIEIVQMAIKKARAGDFKFYQDIMDRRMGKPMQKNDITSGGQPIPLLHALRAKKDGIRDNNSNGENSQPTEAN